MATQPRPSEGRLKKVAWFGLLYLASLATFAAVVYGLRSLIPH
ncbi:hypothetical protein [Microvirga puerhi]|nr:hypothetical protein [Microvirga puerhi]